MTDINRYTVKCGSEELKTFVRRIDAVNFARAYSRDFICICHVVDNGGRFEPQRYMHGFFTVEDDV